MPAHLRLALPRGATNLAVVGLGPPNVSGAGEAEEARLYDIAANELRDALPGSGRYVAVSDDGTRLVTGRATGLIRLWELPSQRLIREIEVGAPLLHFALSPDGHWLAVHVGWGQRVPLVRLWDLDRGHQFVCAVPAGESVNGLAFSPDSGTLATAGTDSTVRTWSVETREALWRGAGHHGPVLGVAFSPTGQRLASVGSDNTLRVWNPSPASARPPARGSELRQLAFSPDGREIVALTTAGVVIRRGLVGIEETALPWVTNVWKFSWSELGGEFAVVTRESSNAPLVVITQSLSPGAAVHRVELDHSGGFGHQALSQHGRWLAASRHIGGGKYSLGCWDLLTGLIIGPELSQEKPAGGPWSLAVSTNAQMLAVVRYGHSSVDLFDLPGGRLRRHFVAHGGERVRLAAFTPDGRLLTSGFDNTVAVHDPRNGRRLGVLAGHLQPVVNMAVSPDGRTLATTSGDKTIRLWSLESYRELGVLDREGTAWYLAFSPDGTTLATLMPGGFLKTFRAPPLTEFTAQEF